MRMMKRPLPLLRCCLLILVLQNLAGGILSCSNADHDDDEAAAEMQLWNQDGMHTDEDVDHDNHHDHISHLRRQNAQVVKEKVVVERCGFEDPTPEDMDRDQKLMRKWIQQNRPKNGETSLRSKSLIQYEIPVYFHVIQAGTFQGLVPDTRIQEHLRFLNVSFARSRAPFVFRLAGITRTV